MLPDFTTAERQLIERCVRTVVVGPFVKDGVFHQVIGMKRMDAIRMIADWPTIDDSEDFGAGRTLINNSLNAIRSLSGPLHIKDSDWQEWIGTASRQEVQELFQKYHSGYY